MNLQQQTQESVATASSTLNLHQLESTNKAETRVHLAAASMKTLDVHSRQAS